MAHHLRSKTKTKAVVFCGTHFCVVNVNVKSQRQPTHRYSRVRLQRPHTHTHHSEKKLSIEPSLGEWTGCWERQKGEWAERQCLYILRYPATTSSWMTLRMTHVQRRSIKKKKQTFLNRGLHLRALRLHVLFHSCTVSEKKKLPPPELKPDSILPTLLSTGKKDRRKKPCFFKSESSLICLQFA